jgi:hypothetical protein
MSEIKLHKTYSGILEDQDREGYDFYFMDCLAEDQDGEFFEYEICSNDFDALYTIQKHFNSPTIEPYLLTIPDMPSMEN